MHDEGRAPARTRPPVMADVARLAEVSHQTVSRVLNDHPNVHPATREKVCAAIRRLGYRPNRAARCLVTRRTRALGVVSADSAAHGSATILAGFERSARAAGYSVTVAALTAPERHAVADAVWRLACAGVDGIVVVGPRDGCAESLCAPRCGVPVVSVGSTMPAAAGCVGVENRAGAYLATAYLLDLSHPTVHHVSGPASWPDLRERAAGWRQALSARGLPAPAMMCAPDLSARSGYRAGRAAAVGITARGAQITALLCAGDHLALGVLRGLQDAGLRVPEDVSVLGFDDIPESAYFGPPLTTMRLDYHELGRRALETLVDRLDSHTRDDVREAPGSAGAAVHLDLVSRDSCAPPQRSRRGDLTTTTWKGSTMTRRIAETAVQAEIMSGVDR